MVTIKRTDSDDEDFRSLIKDLDNHLEQQHKEEHAVCKQYNKPETIKFVVVAYNAEGEALGCGAIREYASGIMEIKRMFVHHQGRRKGVASSILSELENWAIELNAKKCILETGNKLAEAIALYKRNDYRRIPNYGQYQTIETSICFEKELV